MRSLNTNQVYISRDGQKMKLGHLRGVGKVNNLGFMSSCPDIYLNLENNILDDKLGGGSTTSAGNNLGASSKKTEN
jgi:hypothetical protein